MGASEADLARNVAAHPMLDVDPRALPRHGAHPPYAPHRNAATFPGRSGPRGRWLVFAIFALLPGADASANASGLMPGELTCGTDLATSSILANMTRVSAETSSAFGRSNLSAREPALISELDPSTMGSSSARLGSVLARMGGVKTSTPGATSTLGCNSELGYNSKFGYTSTTDASRKCGQGAVATPSTAVALPLLPLSAEEMMPRHMRGFWSRAVRPTTPFREGFLRWAPPTLPCIFYYCALFAAAASYVLAAPNDKAMRSRLRLALLLLCVGLPVAAALHDPGHEKAGGDETSFDATPPLTNASTFWRVTRRLTVTIVQPGDGTLQAAYDAASAGDELVLANGTYTGSHGNGLTYGSYNVLTINKNITIRAQHAGQAVLDGGYTGQSSYNRRVIYVGGGDVVLDGLVITRGRAYVSQCTEHPKHCSHSRPRNLP